MKKVENESQIILSESWESCQFEGEIKWFIKLL